MTISDAQRHKLHTRLDQVLGEEDAAVLISHLPPSGWSDVARTRDLEVLEAQLSAKFDAKFDVVDAQFDALEARLTARIDAVDAKFDVVDARFDRVDTEFGVIRADLAATEARLRADLERGLREQTNRFFVGLGGGVSILAALQALLA